MVEVVECHFAYDTYGKWGGVGAFLVGIDDGLQACDFFLRLVDYHACGYCLCSGGSDVEHLGV